MTALAASGNGWSSRHLFVIDTNKEQLAIQEANTLGIPVVAILSSDPKGISYPFNDDAMRAISLDCDTVLAGLQEEMIASGVDVGASAPVEPVEPRPKPLPSEAAAELKAVAYMGVPPPSEAGRHDCWSPSALLGS